MNKDIIIVFGFVIVVLMLCKLCNIIVMYRYEKNNTIKNNSHTIKYGAYIDSFEKLELVGVGDDGNSDFEFIQAVKKN